MTLPDLSIVVPWCDRAELGRTLAVNLKNTAASHVEFVVANVGGDREQLASLLPDSDRIRVVNASVRFNRALACNIGLVAARGEGVLVLDADVILEPTTIAEISGELGPSKYVTVAEVAESEPSAAGGLVRARSHHTTLELSDGRTASVCTSAVFPRSSTRQGVGLIAGTKEDLRRVQGWNSDLTGWGFEDCDMAFRLQLSGCATSTTGKVLHLTHDDTARDIRGPSKQANDAHNAEIAYSNYAKGNLLGTLRRDARFIRQD